MLLAPKGIKRLTFADILRRGRTATVRKRLHHYSEGEDLINTQTNTFNIIQSREILKNVHISVRMAHEIAREQPEKDVWYINTYAGDELMNAEVLRETKRAMSIAGPHPPATEAGDSSLEEEDAEESEEESEFGMSAEEEFMELMPNLFMLEVATGEWNSEALLRDIMDRGRGSGERDLRDTRDQKDGGHGNAAGEAGAKPAGKQFLAIEERPDVVVIINSFEFASINYHQKRKIVLDLIQLQERMTCSFVLFSHQPKQDVVAGLPGRGPMGLLVAKAEVVLTLGNPFEHLIRKRNTRNQRVTGDIHEAQTKNTDVQTEKKKKVKIEPDYLFSEFKVNPWLDKTERSGRYLASFAIDWELSKYYEAHGDEVFVKGQEPSSMSIKRGTYVQPQPVRKWVEPR